MFSQSNLYNTHDDLDLDGSLIDQSTQHSFPAPTRSFQTNISTVESAFREWNLSTQTSSVTRRSSEDSFENTNKTEQEVESPEFQTNTIHNDPYFFYRANCSSAFPHARGVDSSESRFLSSNVIKSSQEFHSDQNHHKQFFAARYIQNRSSSQSKWLLDQSASINSTGMCSTRISKQRIDSFEFPQHSAFQYASEGADYQTNNQEVSQIHEASINYDAEWDGHSSTTNISPYAIAEQASECNQSNIYLQEFFSKMSRDQSETYQRNQPPPRVHRFKYPVSSVKRADIYSLSRDQNGCRYLQAKLEENNTAITDMIFEECYPYFADLMTDPFGNYLCQKLFEYCNEMQKVAIINLCAPNLGEISMDMHGTRAVQRLIECMDSQLQNQLFCKALVPHAKLLMNDVNGNHVIHKCLHRMSPQHNQFCFDIIELHCFELATHRHGCCVIQRCLDYASPIQRNQIIIQITKNALALVQDPYGNYVVQYVLALKRNNYTLSIIENLRGFLAHLSVQKFSSNVVEKCLQQARSDVRDELIDELMGDPVTVAALVQDCYGNYVLQRVLSVAPPYKMDEVCEAIQPYLASLKNTPYGKRILNKLIKFFPKQMIV